MRMDKRLVGLTDKETIAIDEEEGGAGFLGLHLANGEEGGGREFGDGGGGLCLTTGRGLEFVCWGAPLGFLSSLSPSPEIGDGKGT
ncbi:hypothetical protein TIFTF001_024139 [Ficus carica]|uniref:Uncharacterized protein n=1 Tax=Ficus carica TaxID=3494 RepID=A0AA88DEF9_FICCA|nr:hypothetical protein TIFTF001_024139 [Ficus carica]